MKNKLAKLSAVAVLTGSMLMSTSCTDQLNEAAQDWKASGDMWQSSSDFLGNIYALQNMFRGNYAMNILFWAGELRAGQFTLALINGSGALNDQYINNNYSYANYQFNNFMNTPGFIADLNELIYYLEQRGSDYLTDAQMNGLLAQAYGWRAYTYFQVYKMYGGAVIFTEPNVVIGITNPDELNKPRSTAEETLNQIKSDISTALNYFNASSDFPAPATSATKDYYWNKAATEMLQGEVYLWSAKVSTGNHQATGPNSSDVATAKQAFQNVISNYGYSLYNNWLGIWQTPHNSESIYAMCYSNTVDGVYATGVQNQITWAKAQGGGTTAWSIQGPSGFDKVAYDPATGTYANASRFGYYTTDPTSQGAIYTNYEAWNPSPNRYMWKNALYYQYDALDGRLASWFPQWYISASELRNDVFGIENFDPKEYDLQGSFILKFVPRQDPTTTTPNLVNINDQFIYRLTLAYTYMAEIANLQGNYGEIAQWINPIRQRAYGANWDENTYGFKPSTFAENEAMILQEKNKEFMIEGQRWWDLRRMTVDQSCSDEFAHLVFQPQGCIGYGLNPGANPWQLEAGGQGVQSVVETATPVLTTSEAYKLLWPIDPTLYGSDETILQNPGYDDPDGRGYQVN